MSNEEIQNLRDVVELKVTEFANKLSVGVLKGYRIYEITDLTTNEVDGILLEMYVNKSYHYYDFLLRSWKNELAADDLYITYKMNRIAICFKIRAF